MKAKAATRHADARGRAPRPASRSRIRRAKLTLRPGEYEYKFVIDGLWFHDPEGECLVMNEHGTLNTRFKV